MVRGNDQLIKLRRILIGFTPLALIALIFFIFLGSSGCKVASSTRDAYLVGIYAPGNSTNYAMLRDVGFSHIVSSANLANLDAAHSAGLQVSPRDYKHIRISMQSAFGAPCEGPYTRLFMLGIS